MEPLIYLLIILGIIYIGELLDNQMDKNKVVQN